MKKSRVIASTDKDTLFDSAVRQDAVPATAVTHLPSSTSTSTSSPHVGLEDDEHYDESVQLVEHLLALSASLYSGRIDEVQRSLSTIIHSSLSNHHRLQLIRACVIPSFSHIARFMHLRYSKHVCGLMDNTVADAVAVCLPTLQGPGLSPLALQRMTLPSANHGLGLTRVSDEQLTHIAYLSSFAMACSASLGLRKLATARPDFFNSIRYAGGMILCNVLTKAPFVDNVSSRYDNIVKTVSAEAFKADNLQRRLTSGYFDALAASIHAKLANDLRDPSGFHDPTELIRFLSSTDAPTKHLAGISGIHAPSLYVSNEAHDVFVTSRLPGTSLSSADCRVLLPQEDVLNVPAPPPAPSSSSSSSRRCRQQVAASAVVVLAPASFSYANGSLPVSITSNSLSSHQSLRSALHNVIATISAMFEPNRSETHSRAVAEFEALTRAPGTAVARYIRRAVMLRDEAGPDRIPVVSAVKVISAADFTSLHCPSPTLLAPPEYRPRRKNGRKKKERMGGRRKEKP